MNKELLLRYAINFVFLVPLLFLFFSNMTKFCTWFMVPSERGTYAISSCIEIL